MHRTRVDILYSPGCLTGAVFQSIDVLAVANQLWRLNNPGKRTAPFLWQIIDVRGDAMALPDWQQPSPSHPWAALDLPPAQTALVVPGLMMQNIPHMNRILASQRAEIDLIAARYAAGSAVAASFNGAVMLARAGILDGREAMTSWLIASWFATEFKAVRLVMDRPVTVDGRIFCSGAPAAHTELMLQVVRHFAGDELANRCASGLLYQQTRFEQSAQTQTLLTRDSVVFKARRWLEQHLTEPYSLTATAAAAAVSTRTLLRHFREVQDMTPLDYLHRLRVERARQLLEVTMLDLPEILEQCGYQDPSAFRRLFHRETGLSPSEYRSRYAVRASRRRWRAEEPI